MDFRPGLLAAFLVFLVAGTALGQERTIRGQVTDSVTMQPVSNPSVSIQGTEIGTIGEADGSFVLEGAPAGDVTLLVQRIGFRSVEVDVPAGQSRVEVQLATDYLRLEELVVTGRATSIERQNLATAVSTVSGEELNEGTASTVDEALQGKVAGANIVKNSGAPGGGVQVRFRGGSSIFASTDPLYVVDGVVLSNEAIPNALNVLTGSAGGTSASSQDDAVNRIADLNPEDIANIEVLKGATAAAQYGSRASNGVVLITTSQGSSATRVQIQQRLGFSDLSNTLGSRNWSRSDAVDVHGAALVDEHFQEGRRFANEEALAGRNDVNVETSVSASGGDSETQYFASGLFRDEEGIIANTGYEKQSLRLNLNRELGERWNLDVSTNVIHSNAARGITNNDNRQVSYYMVLQGTPSYFDLRPGSDGEFPVNPYMGNGNNPLQTAALTENAEDVWRGIASANLEWNAIAGDVNSLTFRSTTGADVFQQENELFAPPSLFFEDFDGLPGTSLLSNSQNVNFNTNLNAVWAYTPDEDYSLTTSAGLQYGRQELEIARVFARNLTAGQRNIDAGNTTSLEETRELVKDFGVYLQEDFLGLDERLFVSGSIRFDQTSANGNPDDVFIFPSGQVSYRFPDLGSAVQEVKLRAAVGQSGNQPLFGQKFTTLSATNNIEGIPGVVPPNTAGATAIEPERTTEFEGGIDVILFDGRARLETTAYRQEIDNLILQRSLPPSKGVTSQFFNGGELRSEGIELGLQASPVVGERLRWDVMTTFSTNRTEVTSLPVPDFDVPGGFGIGADPRIVQGESLTGLWGPGVDEDGNPGVVMHGNSAPDFTASFSTDLQVASFRLHGLLDWRHGQEVVNLTQLLYDLSANSADYVDTDGTIERPDECGDSCSGQERVAAAFPSAASGLPARHDVYVQDGSFAKLREVSLSYQLPTSALEVLPVGFSGLRLALTGRNLATFTPYVGLDPEVSNFGNQPAGRNIDVAPFPPSRSFWFSVNATF